MHAALFAYPCRCGVHSCVSRSVRSLRPCLALCDSVRDPFDPVLLRPCPARCEEFRYAVLLRPCLARSEGFRCRECRSAVPHRLQRLFVLSQQLVERGMFLSGVHPGGFGVQQLAAGF